MNWLCVVLTISLLACGKSREEKCVRFEKGYFTHVSGADSGKVNQAIILTVSFSVTDGCGQFNSFQENGSANERIISILAKHSGCICTTDLPSFTSEYRFIAESAGTYYLQFETQGAKFISDTLVVSE